jgi:hypothetical protein
MDPIVPLTGLGCIIAFVVASRADEGDWVDSVLAAGALTLSYAASNLSYIFGQMHAFALIDAICCAFFYYGFRFKMDGWRLGLLMLACIQLGNDIYLELKNFAPYSGWAVVQNALFGVMLVLAAWSGVGNVWACFRDRLRSVRNVF